MLAFLSPAKNMRACSKPAPRFPTGRPFGQTARLLEALRAYSPWQLEELLRVNADLALRAFSYYRDYSPSAQGTPALLSYHGLAYQSLAPDDFTQEDLRYAQEHLRILSAFYGVLRACEPIQPYRLEFLCRLKVEGKSLYQLWGDTLYQELFSSKEPVVNLASAEYSKAVSPYLSARDIMITCDFLLPKKGGLKMLATASKIARGRMARYIIKNRIDRPEDLKLFNDNGYEFCPSLSSGQRYVFIQSQV